MSYIYINIYLPKVAVRKVVSLSYTLLELATTVLPLPSPIIIIFVFFVPIFTFSSYLQLNNETSEFGRVDRLTELITYVLSSHDVDYDPPFAFFRCSSDSFSNSLVRVGAVACFGHDEIGLYFRNWTF